MEYYHKFIYKQQNVNHKSFINQFLVALSVTSSKQPVVILIKGFQHYTPVSSLKKISSGFQHYSPVSSLGDCFGKRALRQH